MNQQNRREENIKKAIDALSNIEGLSFPILSDPESLINTNCSRT